METPSDARGNVTNDLQIACEELNRRGYSARLCEVRYCGERDPRLVVRSPGSRLLVEVLAPLDDVATGCWHATRCGGQRRTVWCGPALAELVSGLDLVPLVVDLLNHPESVLATRYRRCDPE